MEKVFRGKTLKIKVDNAAHREGNPRKYIVNGKETEAGLIPADELQEVNEITVIM